MVRNIIIILALILLTSCGASTKSYSNRRSLMLLDITELPRNAKFASPKYQQSLKKSMKKHHRNSKRSYKRASK